MTEPILEVRKNGQNSESSGGNSYYNILNHGEMTINPNVEISQKRALFFDDSQWVL